MKIKQKITILLIFVLFFHSCNVNNVSITSILETASNYVEFSNDTEWYFLQHETGRRNTEHYLEGKCQDTVYNLSVLWVGKDSCSILHFTKKYTHQGNYYFLTLHNRDTIYFFRSNDSIFKDKEFIVGKYRYQASHGHLSERQFNYYLQHSDSLNLLKGSDLPPLPDYY